MPCKRRGALSGTAASRVAAAARKSNAKSQAAAGKRRAEGLSFRAPTLTPARRNRVPLGQLNGSPSATPIARARSSRGRGPVEEEEEEDENGSAATPPARKAAQKPPSTPSPKTKQKPGEAARKAKAKRAAGSDTDGGDSDGGEDEHEAKRGRQDKVVTESARANFEKVADRFKPKMGSTWTVPRMRQVAHVSAVSVVPFNGAREGAVPHTAKMMSVRTDRVRAACNACEAGPEVMDSCIAEQVKTQELAKANSQRGKHNSKLACAQLAAMEMLMQDELVAKGQPMTGGTICELVTRFIDKDLHLNERTGQRILHRLNFSWNRRKSVCRQTSQRQKTAEEFLRNMDMELKREEQGLCTIVCMDESHVHSAHAPTMGWNATGRLLGRDLVDNVLVEKPGTKSKEGDEKGATRHGVLFPARKTGKISRALRKPYL